MLKGTGKRWQIAGSDPQAFNDPDQPPRVVIREEAANPGSGRLSVAPCSVTVFAFAVE